MLTHILAFRHAYEFPYFVTEAVQYVTTAQNTAEGRGFTIRGQHRPTLSGSVWPGALLSLLLVNKVNSAVLIIPLLVACGVKFKSAQGGKPLG